MTMHELCELYNKVSTLRKVLEKNARHASTFKYSTYKTVTAEILETKNQITEARKELGLPPLSK